MGPRKMKMMTLMMLMILVMNNVEGRLWPFAKSTDCGVQFVSEHVAK